MEAFAAVRKILVLQTVCADSAMSFLVSEECLISHIVPTSFS